MKDIPELNGMYACDENGNVMSIPRVDRFGRRHGGKLLKPRKDRLGYMTVKISIDGSSSLKKVHRLVMLTFSGNPPKGFVVNHINGDRGDNRLENLEYISQRENVRKGAICSGRDLPTCITMNRKNFQVQVCTNGRPIYLGTFKTIEKALECRNKYFSSHLSS